MILAVAALVAIGLLSIRLASNPRNDYFGKQLVWIAAGMIAFVAINLIHYRTLGRFAYAFFILTILMLGLLLVGKFLHMSNQFIDYSHGAYRWFRPFGNYIPSFDFKIQPSELAKITFILALAWYLRHRENYRNLSGLLGPFAVACLPILLILPEPDLGTALLFLPILFAMLFAAGARRRHLLAVIALGLLAAPIMYFFVLEDYQKGRVTVLLNQESSDPYWLRGEGHQLHLSKLCIGSGGLAGHGFEKSLFIANRHLPEGHNDFIFALIAHQWGFLGALLLLGLYTVIVLAGLEIAAQQLDPFGRLVAVGIAALFAAQMFINVGMTMGLMPVTGMNLPFVSYGGTSMLCNFLALGLLVNVARHRPYYIGKQPFEFED